VTGPTAPAFRPEMLLNAESRKLVCKFSPLLFALTYLPHHLRGPETSDQITLSEFHLELADAAKEWALPTTEPQSDRDAYVCPRDAGKSTWLFLVLPIWAAAFGHKKFIAAFADSGTQAEMHLLSFKHELDTNELLRGDFPDLCTARRRPSGSTEADNRSLLITKSGFVFGAKGVDAKTLGMKVGHRRPDLLILDDIEPDESNYSDHQKAKRLATVQNAILPLNIRARVVIAGTVTMPGSIIHDLVKTKTRPREEPAKWVVDEKIRVHHYKAILRDDVTGEERSLWPAKWPLAFLKEIRHTRSYKLNYDNDPLGRDGVYWTEGDVTHATVPALTHALLSIDPAVTDKSSSDFTAMAVVAYSKPHRRCVVRAAWARRVQPGDPLRAWVLAVLEEYPEIRGIVVETNQGAALWKNMVLKGMPVPVKTKHQSEPKEVRAARLLERYQTRPRALIAGGKVVAEIEDVAKLPQVVHEQELLAAEEQMVAFPKGAHDDLVDAIGTGVDVFIPPVRRRTKAASKQPQYSDDDDDD